MQSVIDIATLTGACFCESSAAFMHDRSSHILQLMLTLVSSSASEI